MKKILVLCLMALTVTACNSGVKETLGLERTAPDEFAVVERAPLTVPPNFDLVPPTPGTTRPQEDVITGAKGLVLGSTTSATKVTRESGAEQSFLSRAGATTADADIRNKLTNPKDAVAKKTTGEKLGMSQSKDQPLDPMAEAKRLKEQNVKTVPVVSATPAVKK